MNASENRLNEEISRSKICIFIDANFLIPYLSRTSKNTLEAFNALAMMADACLLTTNITRIEVAKKLAEMDCEVLRPTQKPQFFLLAQEALGLDFPKQDMNAFYLKMFGLHKKRVKHATSQDRWQCLKTKHVRMSRIYSQYGKKTGLFSDDAKRNQFSDAIIFEVLKPIAASGTPVFILSRDQDFTTVAKDTLHLELAKSWSDLLDLLGIHEDIEEARGLVEAQESTVVNIIATSIYTISEPSGAPELTDASEYISNVTSTPVASMRSEDKIVATGKIVVEFRLPSDLPLYLASDWDRRSVMRHSDGGRVREVRFNVDLVALLNDPPGEHIINDEGRKVLSGELYLSIDGPRIQYTYMIQLLEWPTKTYCSAP